MIIEIAQYPIFFFFIYISIIAPINYGLENYEYANNLAKLVFTLTQIAFKYVSAAKIKKPTLPLMPQLTYPTIFSH
jgi:hypothetical protein